jgi:diguanylate cyclase (GGDEF)-like protein/PAS domain S-box-containing protein
MAVDWFWVPMGVLAGLAMVQQLRIYRIRREAKKNEEIFQVVTENAEDMIALVDVKGRRLYNSPAYKRILGYSPAELSETSAFEQIHPEDRFRVLEASQAARESGTGKRLEYRIKNKDGSWRVLESISGTVRNSSGEVAKLVIVNRDITERKRAELQLEHNLFHDPLTGLPNRRLFLDRLQASFARTRRDPPQPHTLLLVNIDHFKAFNDAMGAAHGDHVLTEIVRRIAACVRQDEAAARRDPEAGKADAVLFRLGGDEFTILLDGMSDPVEAMRLAKNIQGAVAEPFSVESREVRAAVSVGIALSTTAHRRPEEILKDADAALRRAKALGASRCEVFDEAMNSHAVGRLKLESDLRAALAEKQFRVHYQPVAQFDTQRIVAFEALLRWEHPTQGLISPSRFIEAAEDTGVLVSIGHWLLVQACRQLREWQASYPAGGPWNVTVNLSARQFADARLVKDVQVAMRETHIDPSQLQLEITENIAAADARLTVSVLSQLKHLGVGVVLDDFGTGAASLRALTQFPVDALKIDRSLVLEMLADHGAASIVDLIMTMARKKNLKVIAEGVETTRQVERLAELGCEFGQGFYFSPPLEAKAVLPWLREQTNAARAAGGGV